MADRRAPEGAGEPGEPTPAEADGAPEQSDTESPAASERSGSEESGRASRYPLLILTLILAMDVADRQILATVWPLVRQEFDLADTHLGLAIGAYSALGAIGGIAFGILTDRLNRTKIIAYGVTTWSFSMILTGRAGSFGQLFAARMLAGANEAANNPTSFSLINDYYPVQERGRAFGIFQAGSLLGFFILPLAGALADAWSWRAAFYFYSVLGFLLALLAWRLHEPERGKQDMRAQKLEKGEAGQRSAYARMSTMRAFGLIIRTPTILMAVLAFFLSNFYLQGIAIWTPTFMVRYHDLSVTAAAAAASVVALGGILGFIGGGRLSDVLVARGMVGGRVYISAVAQIGAAALLVPTYAIDGFVAFLTLLTIAITLVVIPIPALNAVIADVTHPDLRGRASVLRALITTSAGASSPLVFGILSDSFTLRTALLVTLPALLAGGLFLLAFGARYLANDIERMRRQLSGEELPTHRRRRP